MKKWLLTISVFDVTSTAPASEASNTLWNTESSLCFSGSLVFYNSYLPEIAQIEDQDSLSARGFALGYLGSSLVLILSLVFIQNPEWLGTSDVALVTRLSFVFVGIWWLFWGEFSLYRLPSGVSILMEKNPQLRQKIKSIFLINWLLLVVPFQKNLLII